jgi:hypothetical protein
MGKRMTVLGWIPNLTAWQAERTPDKKRGSKHVRW